MSTMIDLTGKKFGRWTVTTLSGRNSQGSATWECLCDCGTVRIIPGGKLRSGRTKSCGCSRGNWERHGGRTAINLSGHRYNLFTVMSRIGTAGDKSALWQCICDCGNAKNVSAKSLKLGRTKSCGCLNNKTHGLSQMRIYQIWRGMMDRCFLGDSLGYENYGGRGITVCERWHDPLDFLADMDHPPSTMHSIDRIDNDGNYSCGRCIQCTRNSWTDNCRWATVAEQARNKRNNVFLVLNGESRCLKDWATVIGCNPQTLHDRLRRGWSVERTLSIPVRRYHLS